MKKTILFVLLLFMTSCSGVSDNIPSIIDTTNCELPCWNDIAPGTTNEKEAVELLSNLPYVEKEKIRVTNTPRNGFDNEIYFKMASPYYSEKHEERPTYIKILNDTVVVVHLCGNLHTTIEEITERTGYPELVVTGGNPAGGVAIIFINQKVGISYWHNLEYNSKNELSDITPQDEVECITFFDPSAFIKMLDAGMLSMGLTSANDTLKVAYPWDGYGNVLEKYPPRRP